MPLQPSLQRLRALGGDDAPARGVPEPAAATPPRRIDIIDPLRAFAAMAVAWFHFTHGAPTFLPDGWLKSSGTYGWMGVEMFFVISGFVLPFSMYSAGYRLSRHWVTFFKKRLTRLEPPYIVSIVLTLSLLFASALIPGYRGQAPQIRVVDVLEHVAYVNAFTGGTWLNPVYWTLAVEFQFYLSISLALPLIVSKDPKIAVAGVLGLAALALTNQNKALVLLYLDIFALGIATFQYYVGLSSRRRYILTMTALVLLCWAVHGILIALVSLGTALTICFARWQSPRWLVRIGMASYSLYLLHVPIGGRVINLGLRLPYSLSSRLLFLMLAVAVSVFSAIAFSRLVEQPSQRLSASIKYRLASRRAELPSVPSLPGSPETEPSL